MINNKKINYLILILCGIIILAITIFLIYYLNKKSDQQNSVCEIEQCHGLDLTCGKNAPQMCTMIYELGDICRQYISCHNTNGKCANVKEKEFTQCKSCIKECQNTFSSESDITKVWSCTNKCSNN
jgi:hypothetical protein